MSECAVAAVVIILILFFVLVEVGPDRDYVIIYNYKGRKKDLGRNRGGTTVFPSLLTFSSSSASPLPFLLICFSVQLSSRF